MARHLKYVLNHKGAAMKQNEMAVRRSIGFITLWDEATGKKVLKDGHYTKAAVLDWTDVDPKHYTKLLGDKANANNLVLSTMWDHYKSKRLHQMVLDSAENVNIPKLPKKVQKEVKAGLAHCRKVLKI